MGWSAAAGMQDAFSVCVLGERGGKNAKKRAVVAVARKLAVRLQKLWVGGEVYEPLRNNQQAAVA